MLSYASHSVPQLIAVHKHRISPWPDGTYRRNRPYGSDGTTRRARSARHPRHTRSNGCNRSARSYRSCRSARRAGSNRRNGSSRSTRSARRAGHTCRCGRFVRKRRNASRAHKLGDSHHANRNHAHNHNDGWRQRNHSAARHVSRHLRRKRNG